MCSGWNGRRRLAAAPSKADAGSPPWGPAPAFFMPGGGRTAREPYCRLVSSHVTPKLPRLFVRFRRIVPRSDTMRVVMHGYARKRHAKSQLGGIGGGVRPSWHRLAQPCIAVHFSLPQGVAGSNPAGPTRKPGISTIPGFFVSLFSPLSIRLRHDSDTIFRHDQTRCPHDTPHIAGVSLIHPATSFYPIPPAHYNFYTMRPRSPIVENGAVSSIRDYF